LLIVTTEQGTMKKATKRLGEKIVIDIKRATRRHYSSEEKIKMVLDGLSGEDSMADLRRPERILYSTDYK
jgi:transposase